MMKKNRHNRFLPTSIEEFSLQIYLYWFLTSKINILHQKESSFHRFYDDFYNKNLLEWKWKKRKTMDWKLWDNSDLQSPPEKKEETESKGQRDVFGCEKSRKYSSLWRRELQLVSTHSVKQWAQGWKWGRLWDKSRDDPHHQSSKVQMIKEAPPAVRPERRKGDSASLH